MNSYPNAQVHCVYLLVDGNYELDLTITDQRNLAVEVDFRGNIIRTADLISERRESGSQHQ